MSTLPDLLPIRTAVLSLADRRHAEILARALVRHGCTLYATEGTAAHLARWGIPCTGIEALTRNRQAFGGRVKTISFHLAASLLHHRVRDAEEASALGIVPVDMVVCTFYPLPQVGSWEDLVEHIDIGGPTMVRAAAKNAQFVAAVTDPDDYPRLVEELDATGGKLCLATRIALMRKAFRYTASYDVRLRCLLDALAREPSVALVGSAGVPLRYGENPHQRATAYRLEGSRSSLLACPVLHGKELSYNNVVDLAWALACVRDLKDHSVSVVKHTNPCGLATSPDQARALELAWAADPVSAFGSVVAFSSPLTASAAQFFAFDSPERAQRKFVEVVAAPDFEAEALRALTCHKHVRVVRADARALDWSLEARLVAGTLLVQDPDLASADGLAFAGEVKLELDEELIRFGLVAARQLSSNAIAVVRRVGCDLQMVGVGCGQPTRVASMELALQRALAHLEREGATREQALSSMGGLVVVSDGFLPFPDNVDVCARYGVRLVVQPGGSLRDSSVIERADQHGIAMVFTGTRHFRH